MKIADCSRHRTHADGLIERAQTKLKCRSSMRLFVLAFVHGTRDALRKAYRRYLERGTLVKEVRRFIYRVIHGIDQIPQATVA